MNIKAIFGHFYTKFFIFFIFMENDFFKPTHLTKVWKIPNYLYTSNLLQPTQPANHPVLKKPW